jgi:hypothetical protein
MIERFDKREAEYVLWVQSHPDGYVANLDRAGSRVEYPMVHAASHKVVSSPLRTNYTDGDYIKVCSESLDDLEKWALATARRRLTHCRVCMK